MWRTVCDELVLFMQVIAGGGISGAKQKGNAKASVELVGHRQPIGLRTEAGHWIPESIRDGQFPHVGPSARMISFRARLEF
jgi:hypothetical protein